MGKVKKNYYLKVGLAIAVLFPGIFVFDKFGTDFLKTIPYFLTVFFFIFSLWLYNAHFIDFKKIDGNYLKNGRKQTFVKVVISLLLSIPIYFALIYVFRQEHQLLSSIINSTHKPKAWFFTLLRVVMFDAGLLIAKYIIDTNKEKQEIKVENEVLKNEQLRAAHETFKQQVDPHFLFNTLNTLQSLVKQKNTENTLLFIQELSSVYRYMLTQRDRNYVTIKEEVKFLESYLYLLNIRFEEAFITEIKIDTKYYDTIIPTHTLQLLAENAVKHNVVLKSSPLKLSITSTEEHLVITNSIYIKNQEMKSSGIGLENIRSRYKLLFKKDIVINSNLKEFQILLPIIRYDEDIIN